MFKEWSAAGGGKGLKKKNRRTTRKKKSLSVLVKDDDVDLLARSHRQFPFLFSRFYRLSLFADDAMIAQVPAWAVWLLALAVSVRVLSRRRFNGLLLPCWTNERLSGFCDPDPRSSALLPASLPRASEENRSRCIVSGGIEGKRRARKSVAAAKRHVTSLSNGSSSFVSARFLLSQPPSLFLSLSLSLSPRQQPSHPPPPHPIPPTRRSSSTATTPVSFLLFIIIPRDFFARVSIPKKKKKRCSLFSSFLHFFPFFFFFFEGSVSAIAPFRALAPSGSAATSTRSSRGTSSARTRFGNSATDSCSGSSWDRAPSSSSATA